MHSSHLYHEATHNMAPNGINVGDVSIDVGKMMETKRGKVEALTGGIEYLCKKYKVGPPSFEHPDRKVSCFVVMSTAVTYGCLVCYEVKCTVLYVLYRIDGVK